MKSILLLSLLLLAVPAQAIFIGEIFEESVYGKESEYVKIVGGRSKHAPERRVYQVTFTTRYDRQGHTDIVLVSQKTGRIVSITSDVGSVEKGVLRAMSCCEGEVRMPQKALHGYGLILENVPGEKYKGKMFSISLNDNLAGGFSLRVECMDYMYRD